jgi:hypothetical protein
VPIDEEELRQALARLIAMKPELKSLILSSRERWLYRNNSPGFGSHKRGMDLLPGIASSYWG